MRTEHQPTLQIPPVLPPRRRKSPATSRYLPWLVIGGSVAVGAAMVLAMLLGVAVVYLSEPVISSGVSVAGVDLGGIPVDDAASLLQQGYGNPSIMVTDQDRSWPLTMADLGVMLDVEATLYQAQDVESGANVAPVYKLNLDQTANALVALSEQVNVNPNPPENGRAVDIPVMINRLIADANGELADGVLDLSMIEVKPPEVEPGGDYAGPTTIHVVEPGQELALIARQYGVDMEDIVILNNITNPDLLFVGEELRIPAAGEYQPSTENAPPAPTNSGRSIVVSVGEQRIYAYEHGQLVRSHLVSTGRQVTPTVLGDYRVYVKYVADDMAGPDYFLPQVPYVMYFYQGYGIHGTYWHNSFGRPMSHGCVNLPVDEAQWFFNFADVGTLVRVI